MSHSHDIVWFHMRPTLLDQCCCATKAKVPRNIFITYLQHGSLHCILPSFRESSKNAGLLHQHLSLNYTQTINYPTQFALSDWTGQEREKLGIKLDITILAWYVCLHTVCIQRPRVATHASLNHWWHFLLSSTQVVQGDQYLADSPADMMADDDEVSLTSYLLSLLT
jgi:hypothetical protein